jgi:FAD/FMN-containing dehydrogenase
MSSTEWLPRLDGELRLDEAAPKVAADDFGHIVHRLPKGVLHAGSAADVARTIRWAASRGLTVAARGAGHSVFGRSQAEGGVIADLSRMRSVDVVDRGRAVVGAGATWGDVVAATLPHGLTPPVLTDHLGPSVGGTVAVGGVGATTSTFGAQSDTVLELDVVTGAGEEITCSAIEHAELFDAVRAGLGQVAIITRATLRLVPAPRSVRRALLVYADLASMLADARRLSSDGRFDALQGAILAGPAGGFAFRLDAVSYSPDDDGLPAGLSDDAGRRETTTMPYADYLARLAPLEAALRANGQWLHPHPWLTTFIGDSRAEEVVAAELEALDPAADLGPYGQVVLSPIHRAAIRSPLLPLPDDELVHAFNVARVPATADPDEAARLVTANEACYRRVRAAGGTLYPVSAFGLSRRGWREHFGPAFARLEATKRRFDPANTLTPGYEIF